MKKHSKNSSGPVPSGEENLENYYDLKTDAIEALANADTEDVPEYSKEELEKYRTQSPIRIPEVLKVCFLKWWFAGAMFYFCGFGLNLGFWLDRWIVYSIVLGMVTDLLTNSLLRFLEKQHGDAERWIMVYKKGTLSLFVNILYAFPVVMTVFLLYNAVGGIVCAIAGKMVYFGAEPISFGLFVMAVDLAFVGIKNLIIRYIKNHRQ